MSLESIVRSPSAVRRDVLRARIVLRAAEGQPNDQIQQALDRTQPRLPLRPHRIDRLRHEYKRHGTASLLASLEVHGGQVRAESIRRNNSVTFIRFLRCLLNAYPAQELYVIADNGSSHRNKRTLAWVARHKRQRARYDHDSDGGPTG